MLSGELNGKNHCSLAELTRVPDLGRCIRPCLDYWRVCDACSLNCRSVPLSDADFVTFPKRGGAAMRKAIILEIPVSALDLTL